MIQSEGKEALGVRVGDFSVSSRWSVVFSLLSYGRGKNLLFFVILFRCIFARERVKHLKAVYHSQDGCVFYNVF